MHRLLIVSGLLSALVSCAPETLNTGNNTKKSSIINGKDVKSDDLIAKSIVVVYNTKTKYLCTGTLIASNVVLTAAHCAPERISHVKIVFTNDVDEVLNTREQDVLLELSLQATDFKASTSWDPNNETIEHNTGDIALVKFKGSIPAGFKPATFLPLNTVLKTGDIITLAGFGVDFVDTSKQIDPKKYHDLQDAIDYGEVVCYQENQGKYSDCYKVEMSGDGILRMTEAPVSFILETEFHLNEKKSGTCSGDSGGPAFIKRDGEYLLLGVTSRGSGLCDEAGVYTNALYYKTWIDETIKLLK